MIPPLLFNILRVICVLFALQVCDGSPRSRDNDGNRFETLLSNPPVEQNMIHGSFCSGHDCYGSKPKANDEDATTPPPPISTAAPTASSNPFVAMDGYKSFMEKIISSIESSPLMEGLQSFGSSDKDGVTKKSAATLSSPVELNKPIAGSETAKSTDVENDKDTVKLPVIRRIFRFYVINSPSEESTPSDAAKDPEEKPVSHPAVHAEGQPKYQSPVVNEPRVIFRQIPQPPQPNVHVFHLLTPVNVNARNENFMNDASKRAETIDSIYQFLHPLDSHVRMQNVNYITSPAADHVTPARVHSYPEAVHFTNSPPVLPTPLRPAFYRFVVKEPLHLFGESEMSGAHLHRIYQNEATVPVSQWWHPLTFPAYSKQVYLINPNYGQMSPSGYDKKDTPS